MTTKLVIDTNVVLDLLVFADPAAQPLQVALLNRQVTWLASSGMRVELTRVLGYPRVAPRLVGAGLNAMAVLEEFDRLVDQVEHAPRAPCRCSDPDDQLFIDLAVQHGALLLSKDAAVLALRRPLQGLGVRVLSAWPG